MGTYFARRLLLLIPTFLGITFMVFMITRFVPGGPIEQAVMKLRMGGAGEAGATGGGSGRGAGDTQIPESVRKEMEKHFGFDKPAPVAYAYWLWDTVRLDLGKSYATRAPVTDEISKRFPVSIYFGLIGFVLAYSVCVPLGVLKAIKHGTPFDFTSSALVFIGYSIPGWALGSLLLVYFGGGEFFSWIPLGGFHAAQDDWAKLSQWGKIADQLHHTIGPVLCYAIGSFAVLTVLMKNSLMENLGQDYVRTAFAKGLPERRVIFVHALRNSLIPICTGLGSALGVIMAGSYLIEYVFNIDGIGHLGYTSLVGRDYMVVMGILVINTLIVLLGNIVSDVLYVVTDPRIRFT